MLSSTSKILHILTISCSICCQLIGFLPLSLSCLLEVQVLYIFGSWLSWADWNLLQLQINSGYSCHLHKFPVGPDSGSRTTQADNHYFFAPVFCIAPTAVQFHRNKQVQLYFGLFLICFDSRLIHCFVVGWSEALLEQIFLFSQQILIIFAWCYQVLLLPPMV